MAKKVASKPPVLKVHRTSEDRTSVVERLIDAGCEVLQTRAGIQIGIGDAEINFKLQANSVGAQGFAEIALQARKAEKMMALVAGVLEMPVVAESAPTCSLDMSDLGVK